MAILSEKFFLPEKQKEPRPRKEPLPQELEVSPRSELYLLVMRKQDGQVLVSVVSPVDGDGHQDVVGGGEGEGL